MRLIEMSVNYLKKKKPGQKVGTFDDYMICLNENEKCAVSVRCYRTTFLEHAFQDFTKRIAELAYGIKSDDWDHVIKIFPELEQERKIVEKIVKADIKIDEIFVMV